MAEGSELVFVPELSSRTEVTAGPAADLPALRLVLDSGRSLVIAARDSVDGHAVLAAYLTDLAFQSAMLADVLDPDGVGRMLLGRTSAAVLSGVRDRWFSEMGGWPGRGLM